MLLRTDFVTVSFSRRPPRRVAAASSSVRMRRRDGRAASPSPWGCLALGSDAPGDACPDWGHPPDSLDDLDVDELLLSAAPAAVPPPALRCLEATHAAGCVACAPAPAPGELERFELVAAGGFKGLRGALLLSPEWNTATEREAAAASAEAHGDPLAMAPLLRRKRGCDLNKAQLVALCRAWGYKSGAWQPKHGRAAKRTRPPSPQPRAGPAPPSPLRLLALPHDASSLRARIAADVAGLLRASSTAWEGPRARELTQATRVAGFSHDSLRQYVGMGAVLRVFERQCSEAMKAHAAAAAAPSAVARADAPACAVLPLCAPGAEASEQVLGLLRSMLTSGTRLLHSARCATSAPGDEPEDVVLVAQTEISEALQAGLAGVARAHALLTWLCATAPLGAYLTAAELLLHEARSYAEATSHAFSARSAWSVAAVDAGARMVLATTPNTVSELTTLLHAGAAMGPDMARRDAQHAATLSVGGV